MLYVLLSLSALAKEPPSRPEASKEIPGQCLNAIPVQDGSSINCRGVVLPTSWLADYEKLSAHTKRIEHLYTIDTGQLEYQNQWCQERLQEALKKPPIMERQSTWTGIGIIIGAGTVIGGAYAMAAGG